MNIKHLTVLHINKFHYIVGGAEVIYFRTANILEKHGHNSFYFSMRNPDNLPCETAEFFVPYIDLDKAKDIRSQIKAAGNILYSLKARRLLSRLLDRYSVDIAHIHTIHRQMSPSILHELKKMRIPVVMTLHEYKMVCSACNLLFHEKPCEACAGGRYFNSIKLKCIKDSHVRSALAFVEMYLHHKVLDIYKNVDIFISPSHFLKNKLKEMGFKKEIFYLPNFIDIKKFEKFKFEEKITKGDNSISIVYFGILEPWKGLLTLLEAAKLISYKHKNREIEIKIIGDGPMREKLQEKVKVEGIRNVSFLGYMKGEDLFQEIKNASAVVLPSICYENNPLSVIEAFAMGKPVIGARLGGIPELVKDNETGLTFESGNPDDLYVKIEYCINNKEKIAGMGRNARTYVEQELNAEKYYEKLMEIYKKVMSTT